jgi:hypothetical protein
MITSDARCTREIESRIAMVKAAFNKKKSLFTRKLNLNLREKTVEVLNLEHRLLWCFNGNI